MIRYKRQHRTLQAYRNYALGKQTLKQLSQFCQRSVRALHYDFDQLVIAPRFPVATQQPVNLVVDATFFSRHDGVLVFRANGKNLYWQFIQSETVEELSRG